MVYVFITPKNDLPVPISLARDLSPSLGIRDVSNYLLKNVNKLTQLSIRIYPNNVPPLK
ncbi:hypothetical protein J2Y60_004652 [Arcicella sp. BE140]|nr:hypothetical protein [Arcicella sp. BE51]MDR6814434.1 hypothetical protein [Arcicella sp. BE140]MDR6825810.1 hypothetical protein [Arcicella sp. BE139]